MRRFNAVLSAIICMFLMLSVMNYLQVSNIIKTPAVGFIIKDDEMRNTLSSFSNEDRFQMLYTMACTIVNTTRQRDLNLLLHHLRTLGIQRFSKNTPSGEQTNLVHLNMEENDHTRVLNRAVDEGIPTGNAYSVDVIKDLSALSVQDRMKIHDMARTLLDTTKETDLDTLIHHLAVLRTRKFSKTQRPDVCKGCMTYNFKNMINPTHVCKGGEDIVLFIMITTIPQEQRERTTVRKTWASLTANNTARMRHLFLFGAGFSKEEQGIIDNESHQYGDILQEDFVDNYYNLSYKTIMGYRWVTNHCPGARYIMRTACDNFIHIPKVLQLLQKQNQTIEGHHMDNAQIGWAIKSNGILRIPNRKWYVTRNELNRKWKSYKDYCMGTAFVFHRKAALKFLKASVNVPFFVIEDVYYGMVMDTIDLPAVDVPGFTVEAAEVGLPEQKGCPNRGKWYSIHQATPAIIQQLWKSCEEIWTLPQHLRG